MRLQTGPAPIRTAVLTIQWEQHDTTDQAVTATIDHLADELHRTLWPLGVNPSVTVETR